jgi:hypothetical protein
VADPLERQCVEDLVVAVTTRTPRHPGVRRRTPAQRLLNVAKVEARLGDVSGGAPSGPRACEPERQYQYPGREPIVVVGVVVAMLHPTGRDVRSDRQGLPGYRYSRAARDAFTGTSRMSGV